MPLLLLSLWGKLKGALVWIVGAVAMIGGAMLYLFLAKQKAKEEGQQEVISKISGEAARVSAKEAQAVVDAPDTVTEVKDRLNAGTF